MAYTKPNNFTDGSVLSASDLDGNDQALKKYINQGIIAADLKDNAFDTDDMAVGQYEPITNRYDFTTGIATGLANGVINTDRAYFTSHVKRARQTDATLKIYQSLFETAPALKLERQADVLITFGGAFISIKNAVQDLGFWDSKVILAYTDDSNNITFIEGTRGYSFEEANVATSSGSGTTPAGSVNPFGGNNRPADFLGSDSDFINTSVRRWIGFSTKLTLAAGTYKFALNVNAKAETGFTSARSFKAEVFYR